MKSWVLIAVGALSIGMVNAQAIQNGNDKGDGVEQTYNFAYSPSAERTLTGYVTGKVKGDPRNGIAASMMITMKTSKGKDVQVDFGPSWYVAAQTAKINIGDKIKVLGSFVSLQSSKSDKERFFIARRVTRGHQILALRDAAGTPYWKAYRKGQVAIDGANNSITGQIMSQNDVNVGNEKQVGYQVQTANGLVNVAVAPNWYLEQQGLGFHVGDNITVYTGAGPSSFGGNVILADGLWNSSYGGTVVLRPNGIPVWGGWSNP